MDDGSGAKEFFIKGINYSPVPVGDGIWEGPPTPLGDYLYTTPQGDPVWEAVWGGDLSNMRNELKVNTLKTYFTWPWEPPTDITTWKTVIARACRTHTAFLDACYNNGNNPIYVFMGVALDAMNLFDNASPNLEDDYFNFYLAVVDKLSQLYANHPAIIGFFLGNEMNNADRCQSANFWEKNFQFADTAKKNAPNKLAVQGFYNDPNLFTYTFASNGQTYKVPEEYIKHYDAWMINVYNGKTFDPFWRRYQQQVLDAGYTNAGLILGEMGVPAGTLSQDKTTAIELPDSAEAVIPYLQSLWQDLLAHKQINSGGLFFEYCDEWWKNLPNDPTSPPVYIHDNPLTKNNFAFPGDYWAPRWWGLYSATPNGRTAKQGSWDANNNRPYPADILSPRASVKAIGQLACPQLDLTQIVYEE